ncbi:MAG: AAA family ATPase [Dorea sp.]
MKNKIITISRQFGSGGRTIGKLTAEKLGIPCYDQEVLQKIAKESGFTEEYIKNEGEYTQGGWISNAFTSRMWGPTNQDQIWLLQHKMITDLAAEGPCVIVGRCADFILREKADCLRVFIHASMEYRSDRIVREYGEREESPAQRLKDKDKRRASYYQFYTDMKWGYAPNYHLSLDSGEIGIEQCADIIINLYQSKK